MHDDSTPVLDPLELAWAAGFYDGEGSTCITTYLPKNQKSQANVIMVAIGQIHREVLDRFQAAVGGLGVVNGPYLPPSRGKRDKPQYRYRASGLERVETIIRLLWPYLGSVKRDQAETALETIRALQRPVGAPTKEFCVRGHDLGTHSRITKSGERRCQRCEQLISLAAYYRRKGDPEEAQRVLDGSHISRKGWRRKDRPAIVDVTAS